MQFGLRSCKLAVLEISSVITTTAVIDKDIDLTLEFAEVLLRGRYTAGLVGLKRRRREVRRTALK